MANFDVDNESFDPFEHGFNFAVGFPAELDKRVGTLTMTYETKKWVDDKVVKKSTAIPLHSCQESSGFPMPSLKYPISLMCFDELPAGLRSLTGDYFSDEFNYL